MNERVLAVGGHIGDMDLAAGPFLAQNVLDGGEGMLLALTPGERGHPTMPIEDYRRQKIVEGRALAEAIGAEFAVFQDQSDGLLAATDDVATRVAGVIRSYRPTMVIAHWPQSIHSDHAHASWIAERARFLAGLPGWSAEGAPLEKRHATPRLLYSENWEDAHGFECDVVAEISDEAHSRWLAGISQHAFARGETYGFRYIDFYDAQQIMRGCLAGFPRAVGFCSGATRAMSRI